MGKGGGGWPGGEKAEEVREGEECPLVGGCGGLGEEMGGRTGTPSPGRVPAAWPCDRLAIMVLALRGGGGNTMTMNGSTFTCPEVAHFS